MKFEEDKDLINQLITDRLNELIKKIGGKKKDVAEELGIPASTFSYVVTGKSKPGYELLLSLCLEYNVSLDWLFTGEGNMFRDDTQPLERINLEIENVKRVVNFILEDKSKFNQILFLSKKSK